MSVLGQRPEHLIIREYVHGLRDRKMITQEGLRDAFVSVYVDMIPAGADVPVIEAVHRHDTPDQARKKDQNNLKKLWRAIDGETYFPLCFKEPLIVALNRLRPAAGDALQKRLLWNAGLLHMPLTVCADAKAVYADLLKEFADANTAMVEDMSDDGVLNSESTRCEVMESLEKHLETLRHLDKNLTER